MHTRIASLLRKPPRFMAAVVRAGNVGGFATDLRGCSVQDRNLKGDSKTAIGRSCRMSLESYGCSEKANMESHASISSSSSSYLNRNELQRFALATEGTAHHGEVQRRYNKNSGRPAREKSAWKMEVADALEDSRDSLANERLFERGASKRPRICILGGGFGGLYTALRLESLVWPADQRPQVVLVDQSDRFVFKPLLYEILTQEVDEWEIAPRFSELLAGTDVQFVQDTVQSVFPGKDTGARQVAESQEEAPCVVLGSGMELTYDWLVLSLGAEVRKGIVPGAKEHAQAFSTLQDALDTEAKLRELERRSAQLGLAPIRVAIVGGGYSGVELACTVAQRLGARGRVQIIDPAADIMLSASTGNREAARKVLRSRGVELLVSSRVGSLRSPEGSTDSGSPALPAPTAAVLDLNPSQDVPAGSESTRTLEADLVLWTVGNQPTVPQNGSGGEPAFPTTGRGQAATESTLRVKGFENVFALGDAAAFTDASGKVLTGTAQVAFQQADYAAWNLWASINKRPLLPFRYQHLGEMMTLGSSDGAVSLDFIGGLTLEGPLAHAARKVAYLYRQPTTEHLAKVGLSWLAKSAVDTVVLAQDTLVRAFSTR